jgi:two-component system sensor kinase FixL
MPGYTCVGDAAFYNRSDSACTRCGVRSSGKVTNQSSSIDLTVSGLVLIRESDKTASFGPLRAEVPGRPRLFFAVAQSNSRYRRGSYPAVNYTESRFPYRRCYAMVFFIALFSLSTLSATGLQSERKSVLVLYGERAELPAVIAVHDGLEAALRADKQIDMFSEFLDFARFPEPTQREELANHLRSRYSGRKIDLVVTVPGSALNFALDHRQDLFPGVPIVFCSVDRREIEGRNLPPDVIGLPMIFDFRGTLDLAFQLQPETKEIVCIAGTASFDQLLEQECRKVLDGYGGKVRYRFIGAGPIDETLSLVRNLPTNNIVLYLSTLRDGQGKSFVPLEVVAQVVQQSNVPVYGLIAYQLENGIVGGSLFDFGAHGEETGQLCRKLLFGGNLQPGHLQPAKPDELLVNWRALQKWNIAERVVPANATIRFRKRSLWEEHRGLVIGAILFSVLETVLILALLRSLRRLRRTRRELDDRLGFERLIATLSTRFVNTPPEQVDNEVEKALDQVVEGMKLDRCALLKLSGDDTGLQITHQSKTLGAGLVVFPRSIQSLPWFFDQVSNGTTVVLGDVTKDLPEEGTNEREFCRAFEIKAALIFPLLQSEGAKRAILYVSTSRYQKWPAHEIPDLRSVGQLFAAALAGKEAEELSRENEATINLAAQSADLGLWSRDMQTDKMWATDRTQRMYDFAAGAGVTFERFLESIHPDERLSTEGAIEEALVDGGDYNIEHRIIRRNGEIRWIAARGRAIYSAAGQPLKMMGASFDVTERKQRELEAEGHQQEIAHLGRVALMGEMAASLAHELNQPLTAIVSNAGAGQRFLDQGELDIQELHELMSDIVSDGERAGEIIRGIREMVKKGKAMHGPVDMNQVVMDVVRLTKSDAVSRSCAVLTELDSEAASVEADPIQLQQVLLNLVLNAFDAMREIPVQRRQVVLSTKSGADGFVHTAVRDFGPGLSDSLRKRIFEPFFSTKKDGLGMGLAIARSIVESFKGVLDARNAPGGGALFHITLPGRTEDANE